jgi:hypothetical protein
VRRLWTIPARVREFTGRSELLAELDAALAAGEPAGPATCAQRRQVGDDEVCAVPLGG